MSSNSYFFMDNLQVGDTSLSGSELNIIQGATPGVVSGGKSVVYTNEGKIGTTSFQIGNSVTISGILDEDNMSSNSDTAVPTQQSVKSYVDSVASGLDVKLSVKVATVSNGTLGTDFDNGKSI